MKEIKELEEFLLDEYVECTLIVYKQYKARAVRKGLEFKLSELDFHALIHEDCYLCGSPPSNRLRNPKTRYLPYCFNELYMDFVYQGIDRVDNTKGYINENTRPCCLLCNRAKGVLHEQEFINLIKTIYEMRHPLNEAIKQKKGTPH